MILKKRGTKSG